MIIWNFTLDLLILNQSLIHCVCNFFSFLVHFVPNIPDDHMITIWTMLRTVHYCTVAILKDFEGEKLRNMTVIDLI